jgi:hypothetical protein
MERCPGRSIVVIEQFDIEIAGADAIAKECDGCCSVE